MPRYKPQEHHSPLLPVILSEQIEPGSFAFALQYLVDHELDLSPLDARFKNDEVGASAYDPRVMLKIVLLAARRLRWVQGRLRPGDHGGWLPGARPAQVLRAARQQQGMQWDGRPHPQLSEAATVAVSPTT